MLIHIGFTGTQIGMSEFQKKQLKSMLNDKYFVGKVKYFHHGDCVGADAEADKIADELEFIMWIHPPIINDKRAFKTNISRQRRMIVAEPKPYLIRNRDIVNACTVLIAAPKSNVEELRSGTWSTIRYARIQNRQIYILAR